jgi:polyisoprenoid-binding protein YceI
MTARYRLDPGRSRFTVRAFAAGPLSFFGHSPTFAVRDFSGVIGFEGEEVKGMTLEMTINADSLELQDRVGDADRREIEGRMRREVLETAAFPEITYRSVHVAEEATSPGRYRLRIDGRLSLHGVTRPHPVVAELLVFEDGLRLRGESALRMSDYRIRPVTALGGAIKLKDELSLSFDLVGLPEGP